MAERVVGRCLDCGEEAVSIDGGPAGLRHAEGCPNRPNQRLYAFTDEEARLLLSWLPLVPQPHIDALRAKLREGLEDR